MRALIVIGAVCLAASPACAFGPGGRHGGHHHHRHGGPGGSFYDPFAPQYLGSYPEPDAPEPAPRVAEAAPAPLCPAPVAAPFRPAGPHIVYVGARPAIHGPRVIYGSE